MSRRINKLDQNNSYKRATVTNCASTPKNGFVMAHRYSISLSEINTASSSSGGKRNLQLQMQDLTKKHKKFTKEKKRENTRWGRMKDSDSDWEAKQKQLINENEKRRKKLKSDKKTIERKRILKDTDSEWETESEKSINELSIDSQRSILNNDECIKLFEDPCTPEKTRDMPSTYEETLFTHESPIIGSFRKNPHLITKQNDIIPQDKLLPVNLLLAEVRNLEEIDEDEMIFDYKSNAKTYVSLPKPEQSSKQKPVNYNLPIQFPTNNLRRDQSVKIYSKKRSQNSTSFSLWTSIKFKEFMQKLGNVPRRKESTSIPPGMTCVNGYWNKALRKWMIYRELENGYTESSSQNELKNGKRKAKISKRNTKKSTRKQKYYVYTATDETDSEFETGGRNGKRISFRDFCHKQKEVISDMSNEFIRL